jgi:threonine dehydratase
MTLLAEATTTFSEEDHPELNWVSDYVSYDDASERLGGNPSALEIWNNQAVLLDGGELSQTYWSYVPTSPLLVVPSEALPADLQDAGQTILLQANGQKPGGAYKYDGNICQLVQLDESERRIASASTGNHARTLAIGATLLGLEADVYMPRGESQVIVDGTEQYGATVHFEDDLPAALTAAQAAAQDPETVFIHPYNQVRTIAGQGMSSARRPEQMRELGINPNAPFEQFEPIGGGGVAAGNGVASKVLTPNRRLHMVQTELASPAVARLRHKRFNPDSFNGAVDGAAVPVPGQIGMRVLRAPGIVDHTHTVSFGEIGEAMAVTARFTDLYEPAGAMALAGALRFMRRNRSGNQTLVVNGTGINTDPSKVHEFATYAYAEGLLDGAEASQLVSRGNLNARRAPLEIEEKAMALAAARRAVRSVRSGSRVASGH